MITIDLKHPLLDPDGVPFALPENQTAGKVLSNMLFTSTQGPVVKFYDWGTALHKGDPLVVDNADYDLLTRFIENHPGVPVISKKQMLDAFKKAKDA